MSTATKKDLIDFLWEWTSNFGYWSKLLVNLVVQKEDRLSPIERETVFDFFLNRIGLKTGMHLEDIQKPLYSKVESNVSLKSLSDVKGVNKLAQDQTIIFSDNLTMIYGENASGKSGYGRILNSLGFSYQKKGIIYNDINKPPEPQSATITYTSNNVEETFHWSGITTNLELSAISFFNNDSVHISLDEDRELIVSPIGFHLFDILSLELDSLSRMLESFKRNYPTSITWIDMLSKSTPQYEFIQSLSSDSSESKLIELSTLSEQDKENLNQYIEELKNLNNNILSKEINLLKLQQNELDKIISEIRTSSKILDSDSWDETQEQSKKLKELEDSSKVELKDIAESANVGLYTSIEFKQFLESAEHYIKILNNDFPNSEDDVCIYCRQPLNDSARVLLKSYRNLLNDSIQSEIERIKKYQQEFGNKVRYINSSLIIHQQTFGIDHNGNVIQPTEISEYNDAIRIYKEMIITGNIDLNTVFNINYTKYLDYFENIKTNVTKTIQEKSEQLNNISDLQKKLQFKINELRDREFLSGKIVEIKETIQNKKTVTKLNQNSYCFNTNSISRKTSEAREELIKQNFQTLFKDELKKLRKSHIEIDLDFGTAKGHSRIQQKMKSNYLLKEILSESEQKAIALAEFLSELQLDNSKAPIVFDDPVTSLDHNMIEEVAKRLVSLSIERQVIIFTHSILLYNYILQLSKQSYYKDLEFKFYESRKDYGKCGIISDATEEINSIKKSISEIEKILNNQDKSRKECDLASEGYSHLRSALELFVENEAFNGTVKRYTKNVALTKFINVNGSLIEKHKNKLNEIFDRCCGYIKGHSQPVEIQNDPTIEGLKQDFQDFKNIRKEFIN